MLAYLQMVIWKDYYKKRAIDNKKIKNFMTKNPYVVEENMLATEILSQMNRKKLLALLYIIRVIKEKQLELSTFIIY